MEPLIFFLVVILIITTNIIKARKKLDRKKPSSPPKPESETGPRTEKKTGRGWKQNIQDLLTELQKEMNPPDRQKEKPGPPSRRSTGWEDLLPGKPAPETVADESEKMRHFPEKTTPETARPSQPGRRQTLIESRSRQGQTPEARIGETQRRPPAPALDQVAGESLTGARAFRYARKELRRAVIWYEVLGPPMSLRDPEREMWL